MKPMTLLVLAAGLLVAADDKKDLEKLQGDWVMETHEFNAEKLSDDKAKEFKRTVKDNHFTVTNGGNVVVEGTFVLDPTKKPKTIDITLESGADKDKKMLGLYEIDGDTYRVCLGAPDIERPTEFATKADSSHALTVWKRVKK